MQVEVDVKCMQTNFGGHGIFDFGDFAPFRFGQISLSKHGLYSPWDIGHSWYSFAIFS